MNKNIIIGTVCLLSVMYFTTNFFMNENYQQSAEQQITTKHTQFTDLDMETDRKTLEQSVIALTESTENNNKLLSTLDKSINQLNQDNKKINKEIKQIMQTIDELKGEPLQAPAKVMTLEPEVSTVDYVSLFEQNFAAETYDPDWSDQANLLIETAFHKVTDNYPNIKVQNKTIDCQSSMCKVSYKVASEIEASQITSRLNHELWESKVYMEYTGSVEGEVIINSFYMREGHDFPEESN